MAKPYFDLQQGSIDWYNLRIGVPTASEFDKILTPGTEKISEQRHAYAIRIIAGRILHWQPDSLDKIQHIQDGKANEHVAVVQLELLKDIETTPVGFITTDDGRFGASPDRLVMRGDRIDMTVEVKAPTIPVQLERLLLGHGKAYRCQVQGQLWVAEADKAIFGSYQERMPFYMSETGRDEPFIRKLSAAMEQFSDELEVLMERAISFGAYQAFEMLKTPLDAERGDFKEALDEFLDGPNNRTDWGG